MSAPDDEAVILWRPRAEDVRRAHLTQVLADNGAATYEELIARLAHDDAAFEAYYAALIARLDFTWTRPWTALLDTSRGVPFSRWFVGAGFNAPANCLDRWIARGRGEAEAVVWEDEAGNTGVLTFRQLRAEVVRLGAVLQGLGVARGDAVGIWLPMAPEAAIALLAVGYIGAIAVPAFSGYGPEALAARFADAGARVILAVDGFERRGKVVATLDTLREAQELMPGGAEVVLLPRSSGGQDRDLPADASGCSDTAADEAYLLLYTSGSTGKPKGVVHPHAGFAVKAALDQYLCFDLRPGDRMFWYTDMGWMMGPWLVLGALMLGATVVMYEGAPDYPEPDRLWRLCAKHQVTHLGVAPTVIRALAAHGEAYPRRHDLTTLRILGSTGEPWNTKPYRWFAEEIGGGRAPIINYSGGTEIGGGILGCFPTMPLGPNAFHGPIPGMRADIVDGAGEQQREGVGELVLRSSWPGMTQSLWGGGAKARDDARYLAAYWQRFPNLWTHGDWAERRRLLDGGESREFWYIRGRSDDTINLAGKRVGPAEFESALAADPAVREAAAIAVPDAIKGDVVHCFVSLRAGVAESEALRTRLMERVERGLGHALRPKKILFADELPRTRNQKVLRRVLRAQYLRLEDLGDLSGLDNLSALDAIRAAR